MTGRLSEWIKGDKGRRLIVLVGLLGMGLILLSQFWPDKEPSTPASADDYAAVLEQRLVEMVSSVEGVGDCRVLVTLDSGTEYIYTAQDTLVAERYPAVRGVVIVCDGGDRPEVCERVIEVVTTALNVSKRRVCVTKRT
ncbi:MAG: hypothetical protein IIX68_00725 [Clostridia bacterium]|nr:hypothetical protein [Clostridia bacterium]